MKTLSLFVYQGRKNFKKHKQRASLILFFFKKELQLERGGIQWLNFNYYM